MRNITLTNEEWATILDFLRTCSRIYIGAENDCRRFVEGVLWMLRSGAPWRLLPAEYGNWNSCYKRFARWCADLVTLKCQHNLVCICFAKMGPRFRIE